MKELNNIEHRIKREVLKKSFLLVSTDLYMTCLLIGVGIFFYLTSDITVKFLLFQHSFILGIVYSFNISKCAIYLVVYYYNITASYLQANEIEKTFISATNKELVKNIGLILCAISVFLLLCWLTTKTNDEVKRNVILLALLWINNYVLYQYELSIIANIKVAKVLTEII